MTQQTNRLVLFIIAFAVFLSISVGLAKAQELSLSLKSNENISKSDDVVELVMTMSNNKDTSFVIVWNYPIPVISPSSISPPPSTVDIEKWLDDQYAKTSVNSPISGTIADSQISEAIIYNTVLSFHVLIDGVPLVKESPFLTSGEYSPSMDVQSMLALLPRMYMSQDFKLRIGQKNTKETSNGITLERGEHTIQVEYALSPKDLKFCQKWLEAQALFLSSPLVPEGKLLTKIVRSNTVRIILDR